ncbi:MAG: putative zinc-binding protein, partial [Methanomassiliicoccales archaeon]
QLMRQPLIEMSVFISINGCRMRCCDRIMEKAGLKPEKSIVIDDVVPRELAPCKTVAEPSSSATKEEASAFAKAMERAL